MASKPVAMPANIPEGGSKRGTKKKLHVADDGRHYTLLLPCPIREGNLEHYGRVAKHCTRAQGFPNMARLKYVVLFFPLGVFLQDQIAK